MGMGYTMETARGFMIFFILLALIRFLSKSMDDSIESSSFKLLYQTIDEKLRFGVQSVMDSAVKEAAAFLAGLILAGIGILSFIKLIHFSLDSDNNPFCLALHCIQALFRIQKICEKGS